MPKPAALLPLLLVCLQSVGQAQSPADEDWFELNIRPILAGTCLNCHAEDGEAGLRADSREALIEGGQSGPAIVPGEPDKSLLIRAILHTGEPKMPPDERLDDESITAFVAWVKAGAPWPDHEPPLGAETASPLAHWAFQPVERIAPPADTSGWSDHPIDRFIMAALADQDLAPLRPADKRTLIRRATFDLIGLPPTRDEVAAFLADESPAAFDQVVERLLASPHYGERWGRHWMDVVRYADTAGDNADYPVPEARLYRDYIIDSFNADKPYDQFVQEQLAGDILAGSTPDGEGPPESYAERVVATGFVALSRRYATAPFELWHLSIEDTIETTGRAFLGLTLRCARCHDHKFDPVTIDDYYALYGFFASTQYPYAGSEELMSKGFPRSHFVPLTAPEQARPAIESHQAAVRALEDQIAQLEKQEPVDRPKVDALKAELRILRRPGLPAGVSGAYAVTEGQPHDVPLQVRGEPRDAGPVVPRGVPGFLSKGEKLEIPSGASGRLQLARWLTRPDHPLTARVMVNRVWQHHFGKGIVATPSNFGVRGAPPTHPELLDWLAAAFVDGGWHVKDLHRLIMSSKTYQLGGGDDEAAAARDPDNRLYWRYDRRRLEAEAIRDAMLAAAGNLDLARPGEHPFPPIESWSWTQHSPFKAVYESNHRGVYLMTQRIQRHPFLALFDGPDTNYSTDVRTQATVPLQALYMMNNPFVTRQAEGFARRLLAESADAAGRIDLACQTAWGRPARPAEIERGLQYIDQYAAELARQGTAADQIEPAAWTSYARILLTSNEFVYLD
ncbi:MAG: PSD1 and planctomycete cytochrome C domain-containing protein [Pirellulales bacterium]